MSQEMPLIVYVGTSERGQELAAQLGAQRWAMERPTELLEALAMELFYYPDFFVLDDGTPLASDLYPHLQAEGITPLLILTDEPAATRWHAPAESTLFLPRRASAQEIVSLLTYWLSHVQVEVAPALPVAC